MKERRAVSRIVREFVAGDTEEVLALAQKYASWDTTPTKEDIEVFHSAHPDFFYVAESNKKIIGFVYGTGSNPPAEVLDKWKTRKVASIETLAVDEDYRRRGVATSLLAKLFEVFEKNGIDLVTLSVPADERAAIKLYGKMGFQLRAQFLWKRLAA
jgi:ribosomal protein S18 acetylase RimI-like enzyme